MCNQSLKGECFQGRDWEECMMKRQRQTAFGARLICALICCLAFASNFSSAAYAESLTWKVRSHYPYTVSLAFYARDRNWVWPQANRVWILNDYNVHTYRLNCRAGQWICFGAWSRDNSSIYWGVGPNKRNSCTSCCYLCNGRETPIINLR